MRHVFGSSHAVGKIISSEEDEAVQVTSTTYKRLFKPGGGCCTILVIQLAMLSFVFCNITATYYTQRWAYATPED